jgi:hypothetical protein
VNVNGDNEKIYSKNRYLEIRGLYGIISRIIVLYHTLYHSVPIVRDVYFYFSA